MWEGAEGQILTTFSCPLISYNSNELIEDWGHFHFICWGVGACLYFPVLQDMLKVVDTMQGTTKGS